MSKYNNLIVRYLENRWYKRTLIITNKYKGFYSNIKSLKMLITTGYGKRDNPIGCKFEHYKWPFNVKYFDLIILDDSYYTDYRLKDIFRQAHQVLSDDGELIIISSKKIFQFKLITFALSTGFLAGYIRYFNKKSLIFSFFQKMFSKNYMIVLKKQLEPDVDSFNISKTDKVTNKEYVSCNQMNCETLTTKREMYEQQ